MAIINDKDMESYYRKYANKQYPTEKQLDLLKMNGNSDYNKLEVDYFSDSQGSWGPGTTPSGFTRNDKFIGESHILECDLDSKLAVPQEILVQLPDGVVPIGFAGDRP